MSTSTPQTDNELPKPINGICHGHAYVLLATYEVNGVQLVKIQNPHGMSSGGDYGTEWSGPYSDNCDKWTPHMKQAVEMTALDDGSFYMEFADYVRDFKEASFASPGTIFKHQATIRGRWSVADVTEPDPMRMQNE